MDYINIDEENIFHNYVQTLDDRLSQSVTVDMETKNKKAHFMIDETTKAYLDDPNNMHNLTLSNFPKSNGIYLGQIFLGNGDNTCKSSYNLRIDYYMLGYSPTLQIKVFNSICNEIFDLKITKVKMIKDVIRICN